MLSSKLHSMRVCQYACYMRVCVCVFVLVLPSIMALLLSQRAERLSHLGPRDTFGARERFHFWPNGFVNSFVQWLA